jgi:hypothetical protein
MTADLDPRIVRRLADMNAVYRMYGHTGELLYVGMSGHLRRFDDHAVKRWFPLISRIVLEWHDTEAAARVAERRAIQTERPRYNLAATPKLRRRKMPALAYTAAKGRPEPDEDVLLDVLRVFGDAPGLHWAILADRLADQIPSRWAGVAKEVVSAHCRALGVRSVKVNMRAGDGRRVTTGCRRADVEQAATSRVVTGQL